MDLLDRSRRNLRTHLDKWTIEHAALKADKTADNTMEIKRLYQDINTARKMLSRLASKEAARRPKDTPVQWR